MKMTGEEIIPAPRDAVWQALNDPEILRQAIPGCEEIEKISDTEMKARVIAKVGPVKATFHGTVHLSDLDPPKGYTISGEGKGGLAGFAKGGAVIRLEEVPEGTKLSYDVDANVGGKLASLGSRLIDSTARSMATQFFEKFGILAAGGDPNAPIEEVIVESEVKPERKGFFGLFKKS
jgi:carbon monoxide dehydrogenase subunit G